MNALAARVAYPRLARWILVGAVLVLLSGIPAAFATAIHEGFLLVALVLKYLGVSLLVVGGFFYLLYWSIDYAPDYLRSRRT
jgi:hypothetical protein